jgi:NADH:ubiquinone oxidoreductase subunit 6 (subunit J)
MTLLVYYVLVVGGFHLARLGLRAGGRARRLTVFLVGAAIAVGGACALGRGLYRASDLVGYGLSAAALAAALHIVTGRRPVHCALSLLVVFVCLAGIFVALQAEFLAAITVSINAGAVVVTFLFILMLIDPRPSPGRESSPGWSAASLAAALLLVALVVAGLFGPAGRIAGAPPDAWFRLAGSAYGADRMNTRLKGAPPDGTDPDDRAWLDALPAEELEAVRERRRYALRPVSGYTRHVGWELYTKYTVPFEVASLILTVAVVGAVAVGRRGGSGKAGGGS